MMRMNELVKYFPDDAKELVRIYGSEKGAMDVFAAYCEREYDLDPRDREADLPREFIKHL